MSLVEPSGQRRTFHTLDGLRGVAAIAVVTLHYHVGFDPLALPSAYLAVDLFFMMSGIVIAHSYDHRLERGLGATEFFLIRLIRLFPLYFIGWIIATTLVLVAIILGVSNWTLRDFVPAMLFQSVMLPNFLETGPRLDLYPSNGPAWSLFWELVINFVYAAAFPLISRRVLFIVLFVTMFALAATSYHLGGLDFGASWREWPAGLVRVVFSFTAGVLVERYRRLGAFGWFRVPPLLLVLVTVLGLAMPTSLGWLKDTALVVIVFPLVCIAATVIDPKHPRIFTFFGLVSYPLYVIQNPIPFQRALSAVAGDSAADHGPLAGLILMPIMIFVAWALFRWFDVPTRRVLTRVILHRRQRANGAMS